MDFDRDHLFSQMAIELTDFVSTEETVETISQYARLAVDGDDAGVLLLHARNRVETTAGTSNDVNRAHQVESDLEEGPCLETVAGGDQTHLVEDVLTDRRWPRWGQALADLGYRSVISCSLDTRSRRFGSLNVYAHRTGAFSDSDAGVIKILAAHASVAIASAKLRADMYAALGTRTTIGQAEGILMHAFDISAEQSFAYMRRLSQDQNVKLIRIAEQVVEARGVLGRGKDARQTADELS
jgi:GAF domain-containing protein